MYSQHRLEAEEKLLKRTQRRPYAKQGNTPYALSNAKHLKSFAANNGLHFGKK